MSSLVAMYVPLDISGAVDANSTIENNLKFIDEDENNLSVTCVTVVFATHNGGWKLRRMLEALAASTLDRRFWKIVAVDNNSTDDSAAILREFQSLLPLQILSETRPGKGHALNTAFRHIEGDLAVITDDDVIPKPDWLEQYLKLAEENPDYDMFSGLIEPEWEKQPESWILDWVDLAPIYALNGNMAPGPISARHIFGPNSAFRTRILPATYTVDALDVGPDAKRRQYAMGGDTAFAMNLEKLGHKALHSRAPAVKHIIPKAYVDRDWILKRAERFGKGAVHFYPRRYVSKPQILGIPASLILRLAASFVAATGASLLPRNRKAWDILWTYRMRKGATEELYRKARTSSTADRPGISGKICP